MNTKELTYGEKAVGLTFNPENNIDVMKVKQHTADAIDQLHIKRCESDNPKNKKNVISCYY